MTLTSRSRTRTRCKTVWTALCLVPLLGLRMPADAQDAVEPVAPDAEIDSTRASLEAWLELEKTISKTTNDWHLAKEMLLESIRARQDDIARIQQEIDKKKQEFSKFDAEITALEATEKSLIEASDKLAVLVESLEARTLALVERAPVPLSKQVNPIAVQIPGYKSKPKKQADATTESAPPPATETEEEKQAKLPSMSRQAENVIGVLYQFNKFANKIEQIPQPVEQPDGSTLNVDTVFLGLSYAYFVDDSNTTGGYGWGAPGGWAWTVLDKPEIAPAVRKAVSVFNDDEPAAYVGLPAEIK